MTGFIVVEMSIANQKSAENPEKKSLNWLKHNKNRLALTGWFSIELQ